MSNTVTLEQLKKRIEELERQNQELRTEFDNDELDVILSNANTKRRKQSAIPLMKMRNFVRRKTLRLLDPELSKKKTSLFRKSWKRKVVNGKRVKTAYRKLHYPTFVKMARPALRQLIGNDVKNTSRCEAILDAMLFVTRWRRANHLTSYRKYGKPMKDIYAASPTTALSSGSGSPSAGSAASASTGTSQPQSPNSSAEATTSGSDLGYETPESQISGSYTPGSSPPKRKRRGSSTVSDGERECKHRRVHNLLQFDEGDNLNLKKVKKEPPASMFMLRKVKQEPCDKLVKTEKVDLSTVEVINLVDDDDENNEDQSEDESQVQFSGKWDSFDSDNDTDDESTMLFKDQQHSADVEKFCAGSECPIATVPLTEDNTGSRFTGMWGGPEYQKAKLYCKHCWPKRQDILLQQVSKTKAVADGGAKKCKCGSTTHFRINHKSCPLNKKNKSRADRSSVAKSRADRSSVAKSRVDRSSVAKSRVDRSPVAKSRVDRSSVSKSRADRSSVAKSRVDRSSVSKSRSHTHMPFKIGDRVSGQWGGDENTGDWYPGVIHSINERKKTIHIIFDDGDEDDDLPWSNVMITS